MNMISTEPSIGRYRVGDKTSGGHTIKLIFGQSAKAIVFEDEAGAVNWETATEPLSPADIQVQHRFNRLYGKALAEISRRQRGRLRDELAQALFRGLTEVNAAASLAHFDDVDGRITQECRVRARVHYTLFSTIAMSVIAGLCAVVAHYLGPGSKPLHLIIGVASGTSGAWASVLQRAGKLDVGLFDAPQYLAFQGMTRTLLGAVFGAFAIIAVNAGFVLAFARDDPWAMAALGFVAGISERFVPELLRGIEGEHAEVLIKSSRHLGTEPRPPAA